MTLPSLSDDVALLTEAAAPDTAVPGATVLPTAAADAGAAALAGGPRTRSKPRGAASDDVLSAYKPEEVAGWYRRLAMAVQFKRPDSLAAAMLLWWLDGKGRPFTFDASHVKNLSYVTDKMKEFRQVFLSQRKPPKSSAIGGIVPRIRGDQPYGAWDGKSPFVMHIEDGAQIPLTVQAKAIARLVLFGVPDTVDDDLDVFMSLHQFGLHTDVSIQCSPLPRKGSYSAIFGSWTTYVFDNYNWRNESGGPPKHLTNPNPDYRNPFHIADPIEPQSRTITVYHANALRVEAAGLASSYDVQSTTWSVTDPDINGDATVSAL